MHGLQPALRLLVAAALSSSFAAHSQTHRLDDLGTYSVPPVPSLQWSSRPSPGTRSTPMVGEFELHLKLDVGAWIGHRVRVYVRLPKDHGSAVELKWSAGRTVHGGQVSSGGRTLLLTTEIQSPRIEDVLEVQVKSTPDWAGSSRRLDLVFELEAAR